MASAAYFDYEFSTQLMMCIVNLMRQGLVVVDLLNS